MDHASPGRAPGDRSTPTPGDQATTRQPIDPDKIPAEMRDLPRWVCWRLVERKGKKTKVPFQARGDGARRETASSTDPATWATFAEAMAAHLDPANGLDGVGFVFAEEGPYAGVDFDNCLDPDGTILPWAKPWLDRLVGYAEISPSGRGIKAFIRGEVPGGKGRKLTKQGPGSLGAIEVYDRGRFFTVTSRRLDDGHASIGDGDAALAGLHAEWFPPKSKPPRPPKPAPLTKTDREIIAQIERSKQGPKFSAYWNGSTDVHQSGSEADLALCSILAWWVGGDVDAVDRLFRQSGLYRAEKWGRPSYREPTIDRACNLSSFFDPDHRGRGEAGGRPPTSAGGEPGQPDDDARPEILITANELWVNDQAIRALAADPKLFCRGQDLVTVRREKRKHRLVNRPSESPWIAVVPRSTLRERVSHWARFVKQRRIPNSEMVEVVPAHPPDWAVAAISDRGDWEGIKHLEGIVEAPSLLADGSILDVPGYDERSGLLYEPNGDFPPIPASISQADAQAAADELLYLVADFPFAVIDDDGGAAHRTSFLSGLLTPLARHAINGPCPLFLIDANVSAAGKTKLSDIIAILATGREAARTAFPEHDEEMRKMIISIAIEGDRLMLIDNVATGAALGGAALDGVLTGTTVKGRILGRSEMSREVPIYTVWYATGNNLGLKGDMLRRVVPFRIESPHERPEERTDFRIKGDLIEHVRANRGRLVVAALKILRGYFLAGRPQADLVPMDYPAWCGVVRQAIHWATGIDPCSTRRELIADNPDSHHHKAIIAGWAELPHGDTGLTAAEAIRILQDPDLQPRYGVIRDALAEWTRDGKLPTPKMIGKRFKAIKDRVIDGMVMRGRLHQGTNWWSAVDADGSKSGGSVGFGGSLLPHAGKLLPGFEVAEGVEAEECFPPSGGDTPTKAAKPTNFEVAGRGDAYEGDLSVAVPSPEIGPDRPGGGA